MGFDEIVESRLSRLPGCKFYSGPGGEKVFSWGSSCHRFHHGAGGKQRKGGKTHARLIVLELQRRERTIASRKSLAERRRAAAYVERGRVTLSVG